MQERLGNLYDAYCDLNWWQKSIIESYSKLADGLDFNSDLLKVDNSSLAMIEQLWNIFIPLACGFLLLNWMTNLIKEVQQQFREVDGKFIFIQFIKLFLAQLVIYFGPSVIVLVMRLGNYYLEYFNRNPIVVGNGTEAGMTEFYSSLINGASEIKMFEGLLLKVQMLLIDILTLAPTFAIGLQAAARKIEIILRGGFLCIGLTDIYGSHSQSKALQNIKKFASCVLQGFGMLLVIQVCRAASAQTIADTISDPDFKFGDLGNIFPICLYQFAAVGLLGAVRHLIDDAIGTNN